MWSQNTFSDDKYLRGFIVALSCLELKLFERLRLSFSGNEEKTLGIGAILIQCLIIGMKLSGRVPYMSFLTRAENNQNLINPR